MSQKHPVLIGEAKNETDAHRHLSSSKRPTQKGHYIVQGGKTVAGPFQSVHHAFQKYKQMGQPNGARFHLVREDENMSNSIIKDRIKDALKEGIRTESIFRIYEDVEPVNEEVIYEDYHHLSDAAKELVLHADNDSHLYHSSHQPIMNNLAKKHSKGVYNSEKAKKLWGYHADRAAQSYAKHHGDGTPWHKMFSPADRKAAASHWEEHHREDLNESVEQVDEVAPEGWEGTVKKMKKHKDIDNPWALAWYMKKKGYKSHK